MADGRNGLTLTPAGVDVAVNGGETKWLTVLLPLVYCEGCYRDFRRSFRIGTLRRWSGYLLGVPIVLAVLVAARFSGLFLLLLVPLLLLAGRRKEVDSRWKVWLNQMPMVKDALQTESEVRFRSGPIQRIS